MAEELSVEHAVHRPQSILSVGAHSSLGQMAQDSRLGSVMSSVRKATV